MQTGQKFFNRFTLIRKLGQGGMGVVWLARDESLAHEVALKFLPEAAQRDPGAIDDLKRETKRALRLTHPGVVRVHDFIETPEASAISMEYIQGASLAEVLRQEPRRHFEVDDIKEWVRQLCETLAYAHTEAQVIHRDLKPGNILMDMRSRPHITDFGIARCLVDSLSRMSRSRSGTVSYMSPQQAMGEMPQASDDIYALGATIYEMLTGRAPFYSAALQVRFWDSVPPSMAARRVELGVSGQMIPLVWEETVAACLAKEPEQRPQSALEIWQRFNGQAVSAAPSASVPLESELPSSASEASQEVVEVTDWDRAEMPAEEGRSGLVWWLLALAGILAFGWWWAEGKQTKLLLSTIPTNSFASPAPINGLPPGTKVPEVSQKAMTSSQAFENSLGMKFVPVPGTRVLFCIWETRVKDFEIFVQVTGYDATDSMGSLRNQGWMQVGDTWKNPGFSQGPTHPVCGVNWKDAQAFCEWLTKKEWESGNIKTGQKYRLPTDEEWSEAIGLPVETGTIPKTKGEHGKVIFPWGTQWPPVVGAGNYAGSEAKNQDWPGNFSTIEGYRDYYTRTSPVGSFSPNQFGLYDLSGNLWEWCEDWYDDEHQYRVLRGGSWDDSVSRYLWSSYRDWGVTERRLDINGFRVVLAPAQ
jgi:serine/threonine protein kinase